MPGMMNTILNLGLNDETTKVWPSSPAIPASPMTPIAVLSRCLAKSRWISIWRNSTIFSTRARHKAKVKLDTDLTADDLKAIIADYMKLVEKETKKPFPQDAA